MRDYLGGIGLGAHILYDEVRGQGRTWDDPDNRLILGTGPLAGLPVWGTGGLTVVTRGAMTNGATSTQANGFFGANLKYCGYDAIVIQGSAGAGSTSTSRTTASSCATRRICSARTPGRRRTR